MLVASPGKARDFVRDDARYFCVDGYEWRHARFVPKCVGRSGRYKGQQQRRVRFDAPGAAATNSVAKAATVTTERARRPSRLLLADSQDDTRYFCVEEYEWRHARFVPKYVGRSGRYKGQRRRHAGLGAPELGAATSEEVTGLKYG